MVEVTIETLMIAMPPTPSVVVLQKHAQDHPQKIADPALGTKDVLPIWIGPSEAASIGAALEHHPQPRPMTHDLLANTIYALGAKLERVVIDRVDGSTFYATVYINRDGRVLNIDARPSDSIALAVRMKAPLFVDEDVMNAASHKFSHQNHDILESLENLEGSKDAIDEFHKFLESITPEDFIVSE